MGGGDLNAKKAWHPNTLKNQERVWKAEQAAAEEKKRIAELERERLLERDRAELNKLAKSNLAHSSLAGDDRLHWMYEKPDKNVQQEEYLLGKAIDKNHEHAGKSEADEIPAVSRRVVGSSMLTVAGDTQVDLARKLREDPLLLVKERERAARAALLNNPVQRAKLAELLRKEQANKKESKSKKKKKKSMDLDNVLAEKLHALGGKKGIDLASLLASDDSSSDSSDEKSKKKKRKRSKKSKSKNTPSDDDDLGERTHKSKYEHKSKLKNNNRQKSESIECNQVKDKRKRRHSNDNETGKLRVTKYHRDSTDGHHPTDDSDSEGERQNIRYSSQNETKKYNTSSKSKRPSSKSVSTDNKKNKKLHSADNELTESYVKKQRPVSNEDSQSSDDQQEKLAQTNKNYVKEDRYWSHKQYSSEYYSKDDKYGRAEEHSKREKLSGASRRKYDSEGRERDTGSYRMNKYLQDDYKNEKNKERFDQNVSTSDRGRRNKQSGLSEAEKATKLAEMVAAGAEREKQRERRVADQLAEKEREDRTTTQTKSRNVVRQLPDSLESRIHSNRHYIQRDQRHMNENFARR